MAYGKRLSDINPGGQKPLGQNPLPNYYRTKPPADKTPFQIVFPAFVAVFAHTTRLLEKCAPVYSD